MKENKIEVKSIILSSDKTINLAYTLWLKL